MEVRLLKIPKVVVITILIGMVFFDVHPQTFAHRKELKRSGQNTSSAIKLREAILKLKNRFRVNILFEDQLLKGYTVQDSVMDLSAGLEQNLERILHPAGLDFEKTKKNAYFIFKEKQSRLPVNTEDPAIAEEIKELPITVEDIAMEALPFIVQRISGKVIDENGIGMPGVNIVEKGTVNGTTSDAKGEFSLNVQDENSVLVFSFIGYMPQEVSVGSNTIMNISLVPDIQSLQEVVVVAYGTKSKKDLTGAISSINAKDITRSVALSPQNAMRGTMPGVFVSAQGGDPNSRPTVRIRGVTTFSTNADPLYVVDGVIVDEYGMGNTFHDAQKIGDIRGSQNILNLINPNDIESISVLKDASSAAAYGARAANGVVLITTKKGKEGGVRVNLSATAGVTNVQKKLDIMNTQEYISFVTETHKNDPVWLNPANATDDQRYIYNLFQPGSPTYIGDAPTYDWQDAVINKNGRIEDYNLSISGGTPNAKYYVGGGYAYQESNLKFNNQKRYSASARTEFKINKYLEVGQTLRLAYTDLHDNRDNTGIPINLYNVAFRTAPFQPIYDENGLRGYQETDATRFANGAQNWIAVGNLTSTDYSTVKTLGNAYATLTPLPDLKVTGSVSVDYSTNQRIQWAMADRVFFLGGSGSDGNSYQEIKLSNLTLMKRLSAEYTLPLGDHSINFYAHAEDQQFRWRSLDSRRAGIYESDDPYQFVLTGNVSTSSYFDTKAWINYLGRISYKFRDKYYLDLTYLRQGSSVFNPDGHQWGTFPSVSAAWRISKENFLTNQTFFSDLKLKAGAGSLGNSDVRGWQYLQLIETRFPSYITGNNNVTIGSFVQNYPNPGLTWEKVTTYNVGIESTIMNAVSFTAEYYKRVTDNILQSYSLPGTAGYSVSPFRNIGAAENTGVELGLGYNGKAGDFTYNASINLTTVKNRVTRLDNNLSVETPGGRAVLNHPLNSIYGFKVAGIIRDQAQLDAYKAQFENSEYVNQLQLGDIMYQDVAGAPTEEDTRAGRLNNPNPDGKVDGFDGTVVLGKIIPGYYYGVNLGAGYKAFDLSVLLQGVGDIQRINDVRKEGLYPGGYNNKLKEVLDFWSPENSDSNNPRLESQGAPAANNGRFSDRWVENASFLRLANIQIGYTLPQHLLSKTNVLSTARIFVSGSNLFTITKYTGYDPENDLVPPARIVMAGINIGF